MYLPKSIFSQKLTLYSFSWFLFLIFDFSLLIFSSCSSYRVIHITDNNKEKVRKMHGFYYALPQTLLKVDVTVRKTLLYKGPYAEYAEKYLGITNIIKQDEAMYDIMNVKVSSFSQRDPAQNYFVITSPHHHFFRFSHHHLFVSFNEDGSIQSINCKLNNEAPEKNISLNSQTKSKFSNGSQYVFSDNVSEKIDTIVEKIKSDTLVIEKKIFRKVYKEKSSEEKAKEAADYLMKIKDNKFNIITGYAEVPYTKDAIKYMNDQLDITNNEYLSLFTGDTSYVVIKYSFIYSP